MRSVRRAAEIAQTDVAAAVGVGDSTVAGWELGSSAPDQEKLPALARVLGHDLDDLFPRAGLPDLTDLRCDAGLYRYEMSKVIGTKSDGPVAGAERGERPLRDRYVFAVASAYGVTEDELKRAQERSLAKARNEQPAEAEQGEEAQAAEAPPRTLAEKITLILERSYPGQKSPGDTEIAEAINAHAGSRVISAQGVADLRTGAEEEAAPVVLEGLAAFFGLSPLYFQPNDAVARQVYEGLLLMSAAKKGTVGRVRARGVGTEGLPPNVLSILNDLATELAKVEPETSD
ncbi:helix-turn-helix domain-containing protein [Streptomyces paludis]|uniref:helix-turn-helix domain-containing protein n=1 Tax=Streptomyces paludis TaxID=2282738 RepID=UPI001E4B0DD7|nr:helix-turn-helix transcriptional regulator [Streptomyces paludis]